MSTNFPRPTNVHTKVWKFSIYCVLGFRCGVENRVTDWQGRFDTKFGGVLVRHSLDDATKGAQLAPSWRRGDATSPLVPGPHLLLNRGGWPPLTADRYDSHRSNKSTPPSLREKERAFGQSFRNWIPGKCGESFRKLVWEMWVGIKRELGGLFWGRWSNICFSRMILACSFFSFLFGVQPSSLFMHFVYLYRIFIIDIYPSRIFIFDI